MIRSMVVIRPSVFQRALFAGSIFILASAFTALRATNTRGETEQAAAEAEPEAPSAVPEIERVAA